MCGQQAQAWCWGKMPTPTFRKEDDYQYIRGAGIKMAYGIGKLAKLTPANNFKEWGIMTGFFAGRPRRLISTDGGVSRAAVPSPSIRKDIPHVQVQIRAARLRRRCGAHFGCVRLFGRSASPTPVRRSSRRALLESGRKSATSRVTVNFNDPNIGTGVWFASIPKNAYILSIDADTTTAWNAATTNLLTFGATSGEFQRDRRRLSTATACISNHTTTIATGVVHLTTAAGLALAITGIFDLSDRHQWRCAAVCEVYVQTGTAATTGSTTFIITYSQEQRQLRTIEPARCPALSMREKR